MFDSVVPYIGTWIETTEKEKRSGYFTVVPYIGTWIETLASADKIPWKRRTLYRYVD